MDRGCQLARSIPITPLHVGIAVSEPTVLVQTPLVSLPIDELSVGYACTTKQLLGRLGLTNLISLLYVTNLYQERGNESQPAPPPHKAQQECDN
jgi:hypothetical protein